MGYRPLGDHRAASTAAEVVRAFAEIGRHEAHTAVILFTRAAGAGQGMERRPPGTRIRLRAEAHANKRGCSSTIAMRHAIGRTRRPGSSGGWRTSSPCCAANLGWGASQTGRAKNNECGSSDHRASCAYSHRRFLGNDVGSHGSRRSMFTMVFSLAPHVSFARARASRPGH